MKAKDRQTDLAAALRRAIAESGLSRFRIAKDAGLPYAVIHDFVGGKSGLTLDSASKIIAALGLSIDLHSLASEAPPEGESRKRPGIRSKVRVAEGKRGDTTRRRKRGPKRSRKGRG